MKLHVVEPAEQDPSVNVSSPPFTPGVDVMRLAVGGRSIALGPPAPTIAHGERDALFRVVDPLVTADIERVATSRNCDRNHPSTADPLRRHTSRHHTPGALERRRFGPGCASRRVRIDDLHDPDSSLARTVNSLRRRECSTL